MITDDNKLNELIGGDMAAGGSDRNPTNNSEIETGPVAKSFKDNSDYEKGISITTDKVTGRYRQNIPWFAVYAYGGTGTYGRGFQGIRETNKIITKKAVEEKIDDLVKKSKNNDVTAKNHDIKLDKVVDMINNCDFNDEQLKDIQNAIANKKTDSNKAKTL